MKLLRRFAGQNGKERTRLIALVLSGLLWSVFGEEEVKTSPVACSISVMLLGAITFQMLLFYLVNFYDPDVKRYSWRIIGSTIAIFAAVLLFQGANGVVEEYLIGEDPKPHWEIGVDVSHMLFWLVVMQMALMIISCAVGEPPKGGLKEVELGMKSWALLFAHTTGFAAMNAWGSIQQSYLNSEATVWLAVPLGLFGMAFFYKLFDVFRNWISYGDDGVCDVYEKKWDEETEEAENDVLGLSLSFLTVQAIRFWISGTLPNQEGNEPDEVANNHSTQEVIYLILSGVLFQIAAVVTANLEALNMWPEEDQAGEFLERVKEISQQYFTFANAWCFFYSAKWLFAGWHFSDEESLVLVSLALFLSFITFLLIFVLDKIEDYQLLGEDAEVSENAIDGIIVAFGILVGVAWEQCFDIAVSVVAEVLKKDCPASISKAIMSVALVTIVFPAWRVYILPTQMRLEEESTVEGQELARLRDFAMQHYQLFLEEETNEKDLDVAHLAMKHHRRKAHGIAKTVHRPGVKHFRVTAKGIKEIEDPSLAERSGHGHGERKTVHAQLESTNLLDSI